MIHLSPPSYNLKAITSQLEAQSSYDAINKIKDEFEENLCTLLNQTGEALAVNSGTSAIHLALKLSGVSKGDFVLCQSFTFVACANPILYEGATPIFIDSEPDTWNVCPELLEKALVDLKTRGINPKALIVVHLYGRPAKMDRIIDICKSYNIIVIEDAAEALGSKIGDSYCGTMGDYGVLSFNYNKILSTAGGGLLLTPNQDREKALYLATQAKEKTLHYEHKRVGYNYRIGHLNALLGISELPFLKYYLKKRVENTYSYKQLFSNINGVEVINPDQKGTTSNHWLTIILVHPEETGGITKDDLIYAFAKAYIETRPLWKPMHLQPLFKNSQRYLNGTSDYLYDRGLCLPSGNNLEQSDFAHIGKVVQALFKS